MHAGNGLLSRNILDLSLDCLALVALTTCISTLLLHAVICLPFRILNDIIRVGLVLLQHLAQVRVALLDRDGLLCRIHVLARHVTHAHPHLRLLLNVLIIVEDRVTLARLRKSSNSRLSLLLVVESFLQILLTPVVVLNLERILRGLEFSLVLTCGKNRLDVFLFNVFLNSEVVSTVKREINRRLHVRFAFACLRILDGKYTLAEVPIVTVQDIHGLTTMRQGATLNVHNATTLSQLSRTAYLTEHVSVQFLFL